MDFTRTLDLQTSYHVCFEGKQNRHLHLSMYHSSTATCIICFDFCRYASSAAGLTQVERLRGFPLFFRCQLTGGSRQLSESKTNTPFPSLLFVTDVWSSSWVLVTAKSGRGGEEGEGTLPQTEGARTTAGERENKEEKRERLIRSGGSSSSWPRWTLWRPPRAPSPPP